MLRNRLIGFITLLNFDSDLFQLYKKNRAPYLELGGVSSFVMFLLNLPLCDNKKKTDFMLWNELRFSLIRRLCFYYPWILSAFQKKKQNP